MSSTTKYIQLVGDSHRRNFGQYFTHPTVANFMINWVLESGQNQLYDPAFGLGAFHHPISSRADILFTGSEIDPNIIDFWQSDRNHDAKFITREDYLLSWGKSHKNIICNPPYMRFQKFLNRDKVAQIFQDKLGIRLSGYMNTASAFLLKSIAEMDGTGRLAYIMPLEFLNTGYGTIVKEKLLASEHLVSIISLECEKEIFPDAITSIGIILYDSKSQHSEVSFYNIKSVQELTSLSTINPTKIVPVSALNPQAKWLPYFSIDEIEVNSEQLVTMSYYGQFGRGIATGANDFFVLKPSLAEQRNLLEECIPCITRSSQIRTPVFNFDDYLKLQETDHPILLFSAKGKPSDAAEKYIQYGVVNQFHERFLTRSRKPWYKTEHREPAPLLLGVFSRGGYKVILNRSKVLNLTCFHGFQPNSVGTDQVQHLFLYLSSKIGRSIISLSSRKYGDGLDKFEPNDLNNALVPSPEAFSLMPQDQVVEAIQIMEKTGCIPEDIENFFSFLTSPSRASR
jgi:adenine-specific DNA-methyltransferase